MPQPKMSFSCVLLRKLLKEAKNKINIIGDKFARKLNFNPLAYIYLTEYCLTTFTALLGPFRMLISD